MSVQPKSSNDLRGAGEDGVSLAPPGTAGRDPDELECLLRAVAERACHDSFNRLYDLTSNRLFGIVWRINRDRAEAEDVLQDIYVKLWNQCGTFNRTRGPAQAWLCSIARNHAVSSLRRQKARPAVLAWSVEDGDPLERVMSPGPGPEAVLIDTQRRHAVRECLLALPSAQRETLTLAFYDGMSQSEVAERLGQPLGTVKSWARRALSSMNPAMGSHR